MTLKHRIFGRFQVVKPTDLARVLPSDHQLAVYILPLQTKIAITCWVIPNERGGWKIAPKGKA